MEQMSLGLNAQCTASFLCAVNDYYVNTYLHLRKKSLYINKTIYIFQSVCTLADLVPLLVTYNVVITISSDQKAIHGTVR